ncbi:ADP-ribosyltransferase [Shewanella salipaludis]|uniref:ADP ribosyltransferase domain-containing protein n=1 Tax=Shewanella salipaludis TaxID=2723052 RepID=A0A972FV22_9GAMM|nr:ADP-ribosyltransferase [Shewanella salipaludis]NMH66281.1 hypothetical protein [Shewanella salipaludis]
MSTSLERLLKVDIYDQFLAIVQMNHGKLKKEISVTRDEAVALHAYTKCYPPIYQEINSALRDGKFNHFLIKLIDSALNKLPVYGESEVYRWTVPTLDEQECLEGNLQVTENAYLSTLKAPNQIDMAEHDCWLIKISHLNGRDIALFSDDFSLEIQEVLIPRGSSFFCADERDDSFDLTLQQVA